VDEGVQRAPRLSHEAPGTVLRGPPITVTCECGETRDLRYGEEWTCESCARHWNTTQIPAEDYEAIRRLQLRYRALPIALGLLVAAIAIFFTLSGNAFSVFFLLPLALTCWFVFVRPGHRRRYRAAVAQLPRWDLRAE
jgi:hypothetical protein